MRLKFVAFWRRKNFSVYAASNTHVTHTCLRSLRCCRVVLFIFCLISDAYFEVSLMVIMESSLGWFFFIVEPCILIYKDVSKSSRTVLVKRSLLTLDVKFLCHLQSTPLLHEYSGPSVSAMLEASLEVPFWNCVKYPLRFLLDLFNGVESSTLHPKLHLGEEEKVTGGQTGWVWGMEDHCHVVLGQKLQNFKGPVSRGIVLDNEVLVLPFLWPLAPHIFRYPS